MPVLTEPPSMGDVLKYEVNPNYTREVVTLLAGMPYPVGSVLEKITASGKYTLSPATGADGSQVATSEERPIRIIRRAPDRVTDFGAARFVSDTTVVDVRVADLPAPRPGDVIVIGADSHVIQGEPLRDRERLISSFSFTLDLRPA